MRRWLIVIEEAGAQVQAAVAQFEQELSFATEALEALRRAANPETPQNEV